MAHIAHEAFALGTQIAGLTHGHPTEQLTAGVLAALVVLLLRGESVGAALDTAVALLREQSAHQETATAIGQSITANPERARISARPVLACSS